jgi:hypothetical protein
MRSVRSDPSSVVYEGGYLSTPATSDNRGEGSSGEISRNFLQNLLPLDAGYRVILHVTDLGLGEFGLQRVHQRGGDVHFDLEIPNSDTGRTNVGEGKALSVVVRGVPFRLRCFRGKGTFFLHVHLLDPFRNDRPHGVGSRHTESPVPAVDSREKGEDSSGHNRVQSISAILTDTGGGS